MFPVQAADPAKVLRVAFEQDPTGFDPQVANDTYRRSDWDGQTIRWLAANTGQSANGLYDPAPHAVAPK